MLHKRSMPRDSHCSIFASFGLQKDVSLWSQSADLPENVDHPENAIDIFFKPEVIGKLIANDPDLTSIVANRLLTKAIKFSFPYDASVICQKPNPADKFHFFSMQDGDKPFYGMVITTWNRISASRRKQVSYLVKRAAIDTFDKKASTASSRSKAAKDQDDADSAYWVPTASVLISHYPLYNLLGDYLKAILVSEPQKLQCRLAALVEMSLPRAGDHIRLEVDTYALFFQFPGVGIPFRNFNLWPFFSCLSAENILSILETAQSERGRVIIYSRNTHMLAMACETLGVLLESSGWQGLFVPVMHARSIRATLEKDQGPYIVGIPTDCRYVAAPPNVDTITVDLDINYAFPSRPVKLFAKSERAKYLKRLQDVMQSSRRDYCVPEEVLDAYPNDQLLPLGPMLIGTDTPKVVRLQEPFWWKEEVVLPVIESIVRGDEKPIFRKLFSRKTFAARPTRDLEAVLRERNAYQADVQEAWIEYCALKDRLDNEIQRINKRNTFLLDEVTNWKEAFSRFEAFAKRLTLEATDMKGKIEEHRRESRRLSSMLDQQKSEAAMLEFKLKDTEKERDTALRKAEKHKSLVYQIQSEKETMKGILQEYQSNYKILSVERQEANRIVGELKDIMNGKSNDLQNVLEALNNAVSEEKLTGLSLAAATLEIDRLEDVQEESEDCEHSAVAASDEPPITPDEVKSRPLSFFGNRQSKRFSTNSRVSLLDPVDKLMREKTDAIADIIRSIQGSCNEAVKVLDEKEQRLSQIPVFPKLPDTPVSSQPSSPTRQMPSSDQQEISDDASNVSSCDIAMTQVGTASDFGSTLVGDGDINKHTSDEEEDFVRFKLDLARGDEARKVATFANMSKKMAAKRHGHVHLASDSSVVV